MLRSSIESLIKIPPELPHENARSKKEEAKIVSIKKQMQKNDVIEMNEKGKSENKKEASKNYSDGYIKYPTYDFF